MVGETVGAIMVQDGRVLLGLRAAHKSFAETWDVIGGHIEAGETRWQALRRELTEEVGIAVGMGDFLTTLSVGAVPLHLYLVSEWVGRPRLCNDEHSELRWFEPTLAAALPNLLSPDYRPILTGLHPCGQRRVDPARRPG